MPYDFDKIAEVFDSTRKTDPRLTGFVARGLVQLYGPGAALLDIGTGTGRFLLPLNETGMKGVGLDISMKMLLKARSKGLMNLVQGDATRLPFKDKTFEISLITNVLHLMNDWKGLIAEACRVSRKAVIGVDTGRREEHPHSVFRAIMKEKGLRIPQPGPFETELAKMCKPESVKILGEYQEVKSRKELLDNFSMKTFTFQSDLTDDENRECVEELGNRFPDEIVATDWRISLLIWNPDRLRAQIPKTTFR